MISPGKRQLKYISPSEKNKYRLLGWKDMPMREPEFGRLLTKAESQEAKRQAEKRIEAALATWVPSRPLSPVRKTVKKTVKKKKKAAKPRRRYGQKGQMLSPRGSPRQSPRRFKPSYFPVSGDWLPGRIVAEAQPRVPRRMIPREEWYHSPRRSPRRGSVSRQEKRERGGKVRSPLPRLVPLPGASSPARARPLSPRTAQFWRIKLDAQKRMRKVEEMKARAAFLRRGV